MPLFESDHAASDDLDSILEYSRNETTASRRQSTGTSNGHACTSRVPLGGSSYAKRQELDASLDALDTEIASVDEEMVKLTALRARLVRDKNAVLKQIEDSNSGARRTIASTNGKGKASGVDYSEEYEWTPDLKAKMRRVFGIEKFRLCCTMLYASCEPCGLDLDLQCNANMDRRDIVCIMPTGGGKSLTYQLPALFSTGCTVVISPLISLITDQILHLREAGVEAVMLTGATGKEQTRNIMNRMTSYTPQSSEKEIKLCYVTPEKIAKSKVFVSMMEKLSNKGRLARIVIDEAHCVSQLGHDFRPDYKKLSILRQLFPRVPIMALSATCPPKVLDDILKILQLPPVTDGTAANSVGTVYFAAPLYRANLHYRVMPKPAAANTVIQAMADYINGSHAGESGIIYCLSKKDAETISKGLRDLKIKTGTYHADVGDEEKERLHVQWRKGDVKVVCATIAFGLGIDKGDVRFVIHHTMSKSLEGYYQESGRAGRDGKDADCVLLYRGQDATRLTSLVSGEVEGKTKVHAMLKFAQDLRGCRKLLFANYFSASSELSLSAWGASTDAGERCGHCDNCTRPAGSINPTVDVTLNAWRILKVLKHVCDQGGRVTIAILADLVRGAAGGSFTAGKKGKKTQKEKMDLNLEEICGGKVSLSKDDIESLIIQMLISDHVCEDFGQNAYTINVYAALGNESYRLLRRTQSDIETGGGQRMHCDFLLPMKRGRRSVGSKTASVGEKRKREALSDEEVEVVDSEEDRSKTSTSRRHARIPSSTTLVSHGHIDLTLDDDDDDDFSTMLQSPSRNRVVQSSSSDIDDDWEVPNRHLSKKRKSSPFTNDSGLILISP